MRTGTLYIVSTPIGNLEDITIRAVRILNEADLIAAEDTRRARILTQAHGIDTGVTSYHSYNIEKKTPQLVKMLEEGKDIALISDSGTPGISDPGIVVINACIKKEIPVCAVPGATALITALVVSGKPTNSFVFEGFLSNKSGRRRSKLKELKEEKRTVIVYESPHRIVKFLEDFAVIMGDREVVVARELTKKFEEVRRGNAEDQLAHFLEKKPKGEFVIIF